MAHQGRIVLKSRDEIEILRRNGGLLRDVLDEVSQKVCPGLTTGELDQLARRAIESRGCIPAFLGLYGFPGTMCISVNEEIVHGIPGPRVLEEGDIVSMDVGLVRDDFYVDMARTVPVGKVDAESERLIAVTAQSLELGVETLYPGNRMGDTGAAIQNYVERNGFSVVREYTGHGIGRKLHEEPKIPNHGAPGRGIRWQAGMVVCVEPMVNAGTYQTQVLDDRWTVVTADKKRSAHMEYTIAITEQGPVILT